MVANLTKSYAEKKKEVFLESFRECGVIKYAAKAAGVVRQTVYDWEKNDPEFAKEYEKAKEDAVETLEREAWRRAAEGTDKPVFYQGRQVGAIREYSDTLLMFMLKGAKPDRYAERMKSEITGKDGASLFDVRVVKANGEIEDRST